MNIKELTLEQLKGMAYDLMRTMDMQRNNLQVLNAEIDQRLQKEKDGGENKGS